MDMEAVAHGLVLLVVDLQEQHVRVPLGELSNLHIRTNESSSVHCSVWNKIVRTNRGLGFI
jgi:hypothetical protein